MSQHDYNIANGGGAAVRADLNNALLAVLSQNSGATAPTTTKPFMMWYDTANALIKMRNAADTAWLDYMNSSGQLVAPTTTGLITALGGQIKFPVAQNASADANTLDDYEEGTWTPVDVSGASLSFSNNAGSYVKIGKQVFCNFYLSYPATANGLSAIIGGLPFTASNDIVSRGSVTFSYHELNAVTSCFGPRNTANFQPVNGVGNGLQNVACSSKTFAGVISYYL